EFGPFRLDAEQRVLFREGQPVPLAPKVVETLLALVERGGLLVTKNELMERLWPDAFVEESNLTQNIFLLRKALRGAEYIETVPRRGYRFRGELRHSPAVAGELVFTSRTRTRILSEEETTDAPVSAAHAQASRLVRLLVPGAVLSTLVVVGGLGLNRYLHRRQQIATPPTIELKRLTYDSMEIDPAVSPDGKYLAYRFHKGYTESIRLRDVANGSTVEVMPPIEVGYSNPTFSPDGNCLYYTTQRKGVRNGVVARVPIFGGTPKDLVREVWGNFALSPDGRQIAFLRGYNSGQDMRLLIADLNSGEERELTRSRPNELWFAVWGSAPAWSPDGQEIVLAAVKRTAAETYACLLAVQAGDGASKEVPVARWRSATRAAWLPDGTALVITAQEKTGAPYQLWLVAYPSGVMRRLTNDLNDYDRVSVSTDGRLLYAQQETVVNHLWVLPGGDEARARQLTYGANDNDGLDGLAWMPDGHLLFASTRGGAQDIWVTDADGANVRQLTADTGGNNWAPRATPDGRYIVFTSTRTGKQNVWRMDADGNNAVQVTACESGTPYPAPDGGWVYYTNYAATPPTIERVSIEGGPPAQLTNGYAAAPVVSPDGRLVAHDYYDDRQGWHTAVLPAAGGEPPRVFPFHAFRGAVRWTSDAQSLLYTDARRPDNIWQQPLAGGAPRQLTHFNEEQIAYFDLAPDGRGLALARGSGYRDIVLITNFR
ncbi:MAG: winged helix-turn-helix domain-containing protein, partial [Pyrinomonadaceae bacterium]